MKKLGLLFWLLVVASLMGASQFSVMQDGSGTVVNPTTTIFNAIKFTLGSDATGDVYYRNSSGFMVRLGLGSTGQAIISNGTLPVWGAPTLSGNGSAITNLNGSNIASGTVALTWLPTQTGTGNLVLSASPTLTGTPNIAAATGTSLSVSGALSAGSLSIGTALPVLEGGTGNTSYTAYSPILAGTTTSAAFQSAGSLGTAGWPLVSNGAGVKPSFQAITALPASSASGSKTAATSTQTVVTFTYGSSQGSFMVNTTLDVSAFTAGTAVVTLAYTDQNGTTRSVGLCPQGTTSSTVSAIGDYLLPTVSIRVQGGVPITVTVTITGTLTYDCYAFITQLQ